MPMLVRTPEDILRIEKKDLYILSSLENEGRDAPGLLMIQEWIRQNLPGTHMELLGPSEHSGMILGGIGGDIWVDFSPEGLATFCAEWEVDNQSVDPRFQCFVRLYETWFREHGGFVPTLDRPKGIAPTLWWYTPLGFIHHQMRQSDREETMSHPASVYDILHSACELWPELKSTDPCAMSYGQIFCSPDPSKRMATYEYAVRAYDPHWIPSEAEIRDWFGLPPEFPLVDNSW